MDLAKDPVANKRKRIVSKIHYNFGLTMTNYRPIADSLGLMAAITIALQLLPLPTWSQATNEISSSAQHVVVVLDDSSSMNEAMRRNRRTSKMEAAKQALIVVLESLPADSQVGVVALNARVGNSTGNNWVIPLGPIDKQQAAQAIQNLGAKGGTPLGSFMKIGTDALLEARDKDHYGSYRLLIVTDGEAGDQDRVERFLPDILARGITTDVIGVDMASRHSLATKVHTYRKADDPESLTQAVREVFAETSSDSGDAGIDDFELVAGLPDAVASAALEALSSSGNHPIGTQASLLGGAESALPSAQNGNAGGNAFPNQHQRQHHRNGQAKKRGINPFMLLIIGVVLFNIVKAVMRGAGRNSQ